MENYQEPGIRSRLSNLEVYARLARIWDDQLRHSQLGADTQVGYFTLSSHASTRWEVHAVRPRSGDSSFFWRSLIDNANDPQRRIVLDPIMLIGVTHGENYWADVVRTGLLTSRLSLTRSCAHMIANWKSLRISALSIV